MGVTLPCLPCHLCLLCLVCSYSQIAPVSIPSAAMATLTLAVAPCPSASSSLRLTSATNNPSLRPATLLRAKAARMNATSLRLQTALGSSQQSSPQRRRWWCQADRNEIVAAGEANVSEVKKPLSEKQGPPVATILAGIVAAVLVVWGLWSLISAILGIFFH